jgi:isocitrate dehydrogenase
MFMSKKALLAFYEQQIEDAYKTGVMFSLHVKATMMKVSAPDRVRSLRQDFLS